MVENKKSLAEFLTTYPANIAQLAMALRAVVLSTIPDAIEELDESGRVIGYSVGRGYSGLVCTIIPSRTGVKLGIVRGAELPNPQGIMEGSGKRHRYVQLRSLTDLEQVSITDVLKAARGAATSSSTG